MARARQILGDPRTVEVLISLAVAGGAALFLLPALGRDGLWDPWESHYAEVARRIVVDNDWIVLRWHEENFYSKPAFLFWIVALSIKALGVNDLAVRLPVALFAIGGVVAVYHYVRLSFGRLEAIAAAACLATMPLFVLIARQNITDMPFVVAMTVGMLGMLHRIHHDGRWSVVAALLSYACFGVATLSKGLLGFALPGAVMLVYLIVTWRWNLLKRLVILPGILVFLVVTLPWYVAITINQGTAFAYEFFYLHHLARVGGGVHGERGTFEYFIGQGGYAILPWLAMAPAAVGSFIARALRKEDIWDSGTSRHLLVAVWVIVSLAVFTIARTKFHHYVFPALPALAVAIGVWLPRAIRKGLSMFEKILVGCGSVLAVLVVRDLAVDPNRFVRLFTYAYERPLPQVSGMAATVVIACIASLAGGGLIALGRTRRLRLAGAGATFLTAVGLALVLMHHMMPRIALDIGQAESFAIWDNRDPQPEDRFYNWKMNWRGEIYQSRDTIVKVSRLDQLRALLARPGRLFLITTSERFRQLDLEAERIRGTRLEQLNEHDYRYIMSLWDGPVLEPRPAASYLDSLPPGSVPIHATMGEGMIEFAGYRVEERSVALGDAFFVTLYWRALQRINTRYLVFIHGEQPLAGEMMRFTGNHVTGEGFFSPERWEVGRLFADTFSVCVDYGNPPGGYRLYAGLYKDKDRLEVDDSSLHDGHNRFRLGKVEVVQ
ncbi:MAG: glycosyltransferase family 39 protein [Deltaproteobacteria bacterium]|nr:glycosyltransferase family 39 protein [Deltaproteobacteria bacterium]